ncbi:MAG: phage integrase N-terminal domain-containing protein [Pseudomonadota bacterium]
MKDLNYQLKRLCRQNRDGSYSTQANRSRMLDQMAHQLHELGYRRMGARSIKPKHVSALTDLWKEQGLCIGSQKNRLSALRWWARKIGKGHVMSKDNGEYGIGTRTAIPAESKAQTLTPSQINRVEDPYIRLSLRLQQEFGLRREEAIKFRPSYAVQKDAVQLKASWTKGGRPRAIPVLTERQRVLLREIEQLVGSGALIPTNLNYVEQLRKYERQTLKAGLKNLHGLRHGYAQRRYEQLTGWECPAAGGPDRHQLTREAKHLNRKARLIISSELGHARAQISATYLGS